MRRDLRVPWPGDGVPGAAGRTTWLGQREPGGAGQRLVGLIGHVSSHRLDLDHVLGRFLARSR